MTESEWLTATDPEPLFEFLGDDAWDRKRRLFTIACCRRVSHLIPGECARHQLDPRLYYAALERAERHVDGSDDQQTWCELPGGSPALNAFRSALKLEVIWLLWDYPLSTVSAWASAAVAPSGETVLISWNAGEHETDQAGPAQLAERAVHCQLIRDVFGNPFRPVSVNPSWLTSTVLALATGIYEDRDFDRMPILADALQDAGCDNIEVLDHCRGPGPHVRGCYVLDLLLGKS